LTGGPRIAPATRNLALFALLNFVVVNAVLIQIVGTPWRETVLHPISWFLTFEQGGDSWRPMSAALEHTRDPDPKKTLYAKWFFAHAVKHKGFQYPPTSLLPLYALRALTSRWYALLEWITWGSVLAMAACAIGIYSVAAGGGAEGTSGADRVARAAVIVFLTITFYPAIRAYRNGQIQAWINALFAVALLCLLRRNEVGSGLAVAAMCVIKPQYLVVVLWGLIRGRRRFVASAAAALAAAFLASVVVFGLQPHLEYLRVLRFIARHGESFYPNQSPNGFLNRLLGNGDSVAWMDSFPPFHAVVYAGTLIAGLALLSWALVARVSSAARAGAADLAFVGLAATIASPIAWEHHYGVLLPIYAFLWPTVGLHADGPRWMRWVVGATYVLSSHSFLFVNRWADTGWGFLQSYLLMAALGVLFCLGRLRTAPPDGPVQGAIRSSFSSVTRPSSGIER